ncbi:MAG: 2,3,4,5-tetrahydropyridine-2,6-dicarboxylate N-succinyltransferase [Rickettsia sp.]|nr:2,3,4,5-tetrahydropyridine-2,6-dicarboxylate N-succinyltransferase [Rickettsia sp.]
MNKYINTIEEIWKNFDKNFEYYKKKFFPLLQEIIEKLDKGELTICYQEDGSWKINHWLKKSIILYIRFASNNIYHNGCFNWYDKIEQKFTKYQIFDFETNKIRVVPGAIIRKSAFIGKNTVIMPSFINLGAHIGSGTLIDTWASIGSCAHIGNNCHISAGSGIGGVLEPIQNSPVIIEDDCFIGARSEIVEAVIVGKGSVLGMGVFLSASTKIIFRDSGKIIYGKIPPYSVVVPGVAPAKDANTASLYCAVIIKTVDANTRKKVQINELLRH